MGDKKVIAMIPARIGSTRLKMKNLALINGKPLIYYAIKAAQEADVFERIILNSDHEIFGEIARRYNVEFYKRPTSLGSSTTKSDAVVKDFMEKHSSDIMAWMNPISPLQTGNEVRDVINYFLKEELDSLITVKNEQVHCIYEGKPINFQLEECFAQTQDLVPVQPFVYSIMMWKNKTFLETFQKKGYALFCGRTGYYPVSKETSIIIKTNNDLMLADYILSQKEMKGEYELEYDNLVDTL